MLFSNRFKYAFYLLDILGLTRYDRNFYFGMLDFRNFLNCKFTQLS